MPSSSCCGLTSVAIEILMLQFIIVQHLFASVFLKSLSFSLLAHCYLKRYFQCFAVCARLQCEPCVMWRGRGYLDRWCSGFRIQRGQLSYAIVCCCIPVELKWPWMCCTSSGVCNASSILWCSFLRKGIAWVIWSSAPPHRRNSLVKRSGWKDSHAELNDNRFSSSNNLKVDSADHSVTFIHPCS